MRKRLIFYVVLTLVIIAFLVLGGWLLSPVLLNPAGTIARQERDLIVFTLILSLVVVIPVFVMLFVFAWRYRQDNPKGKYDADASGNPWLEGLWWGIPMVIIAVLSVVTWRTSHQLDPYKSLDSPTEPVTVQVVALQWKWLFIYLDYDVASVNYLPLPVATPIEFYLTSDAPMNSFWIPALGSQIYTMAGMTSRLHLQADKIGLYDGMSANISGEGFAKMRFKADVKTPADFAAWMKRSGTSGEALSMAAYHRLAVPSVPNRTLVFSSVEPGLFDDIVNNKMTMPMHEMGARP